ncbi:MAG: glycosyltransferase [Rhizobiales bacterium 24-66-13]|nr:MAG: glycosyltransferase [Rhizobiales bacterium 35-66-30]OYZ82033.1 MAG: glycosyltransferase [Rhizobiales bacterium 24-66-13]OZB11012.1 MAG: glycosyltransferase [Rhizobiales bacterium 39-66-18]HQS47102.1 glycosyltransferase family 2 protein [Xanthobacteraceae bacterium]
MNAPDERKKLVSIVAGCYNEVDNIPELYRRLNLVIAQFPQYDFEIILIDNCSTDGTIEVIRKIGASDPRLKAILNVRNFGHIRSPYHAFLLAQGDAVIGMASDLEDPPELIAEFLRKWEEGFKIAIGVRRKSEERGLMPLIRTAYYALITRISEVEQVRNFTGFGLYDKAVMDILRDINDPYPYFRGLICEIGYPRAEIPFDKLARKHGLSKGNLAVYLDSALLAIVNHTKAPLRLGTLLGFAMATLSFLLSGYFVIQKLLAWDEFQLGFAPLIVGMFFLLGVQFMLLGLIGEYIGLLVNHVVRRPMVVEKERINFEKRG